MEETKKYTIELTEAEVNGVLQALGQLPFVQVADLINNVRGQAISQQKSTSPTE